MHFAIMVKNIGQTIAYGAASNINFTVDSMNPKPVYEDTYSGLDSSEYIPGESVAMEKDIILDEAYRKEIRTGKSKLYVWGVNSFTDVFGKRWNKKFFVYSALAELLC